MARILWAVGIACIVYVLVDVWSGSKRLSDGQKILWTVLALLFSIVTAIVYFILFKRNNRS